MRTRLLGACVAATLCAPLAPALAGAQDRTPPVRIQVAALDSAYKLWRESGMLDNRTVVVDTRPALPSLAAGDRRRPPQAQSRPGPRAQDITADLAAAIGARPGTVAELNPCTPGRGCSFTRNLATVIIGDALQQGDSASVTIGLSLVYEERGSLRNRARYWGVSLLQTPGGWRVISMRVVGEG